VIQEKVMEDEKNYVVFFESTVTGERYYGPPMDLDEATAIADWGNVALPAIRQWVERIPDLPLFGIESEL
jgi:hypothetical protein